MSARQALCSTPTSSSSLKKPSILRAFEFLLQQLSPFVSTSTPLETFRHPRPPTFEAGLGSSTKLGTMLNCVTLWRRFNAFQASKDAIITVIRKGVEIFDIKRRACLRPGWSTRGIGYFVLQQHCHCPSRTPDCCPEGWRVTLAGSRFLSPAEQRYAPIEGEALAVACGLEQSRYFTQGCDNLLVVTDHKPLVKILGDRTLDEITNSRLFRLKQRILPWRFDIMYMPRKANHAADAASRHPSPSSPIKNPDILDYTESALMTAIQRESHELTALSWSDIAKATAQDAIMSPLLQRVEQGIHERDPRNAAITPFWTIRDSLYAEEGVILYNDRVVVPPSLRPHILKPVNSNTTGTITWPPSLKPN